MAQYTAEQIADTILHLARERGITDVTNLKLQKLLYYAQAWNLAFTGEALFSEPIQSVGSRAGCADCIQKIQDSTVGARSSQKFTR